jgi:hypothetical protein
MEFPCLIGAGASRNIITAPAKTFGSLRLRLHNTGFYTQTYLLVKMVNGTGGDYTYAELTRSNKLHILTMPK